MVPDVAIGRRVFLRLAGFGTGLTLLSQLRWSAPSVCEADELPREGSAGAQLRKLSDEDARILSAIADRMVFTGDPAMPRFSETAALASIDSALAHLDQDIVAQLHWALLLFEYGPPFFFARASTFSGLDEPAQDEYLRGWSESRFATRRLVFLAFKNLAYLGYYSQDATWKGIHYDGPWVPRPRRIASSS